MSLFIPKAHFNKFVFFLILMSLDIVKNITFIFSQDVNTQIQYQASQWLDLNNKNSKTSLLSGSWNINLKNVLNLPYQANLTSSSSINATSSSELLKQQNNSFGINSISNFLTINFNYTENSSQNSSLTNPLGNSTNTSAANIIYNQPEFPSVAINFQQSKTTVYNGTLNSFTHNKSTSTQFFTATKLGSVNLNYNFNYFKSGNIENNYYASQNIQFLEGSLNRMLTKSTDLTTKLSIQQGKSKTDNITTLSNLNYDLQTNVTHRISSYSTLNSLFSIKKYNNKILNQKDSANTVAFSYQLFPSTAFTLQLLLQDDKQKGAVSNSHNQRKDLLLNFILSNDTNINLSLGNNKSTSEQTYFVSRITTKIDDRSQVSWSYQKTYQKDVNGKQTNAMKSVSYDTIFVQDANFSTGLSLQLSENSMQSNNTSSKTKNNSLSWTLSYSPSANSILNSNYSFNDNGQTKTKVVSAMLTQQFSDKINFGFRYSKNLVSQSPSEIISSETSTDLSYLFDRTSSLKVYFQQLRNNSNNYKTINNYSLAYNLLF